MCEFNYKIKIIKLTEEDGGGYLAYVPELPGCMSDGETLEEALKNVQDTIKCWIETAKELGRKVPEFDKDFPQLLSECYDDMYEENEEEKMIFKLMRKKEDEEFKQA